MKAPLRPVAILVPCLGFGLLLPGEEPAATSGAAQDPFHPGPQHAMLQRLAGTWDAVLIVKDEKGMELRTRGTLTTVKQVGFHTIDSFEGEFLGRMLSGHGMSGYCAARRQYFRYWTDSMTASPMTLHGEYDAAKRELRMQGECLGRSGQLEKCRTVTRFKDDDHMEWELLGAGPDGDEHRGDGLATDPGALQPPRAHDGQSHGGAQSRRRRRDGARPARRARAHRGARSR